MLCIFFLYWVVRSVFLFSGFLVRGICLVGCWIVGCICKGVCFCDVKLFGWLSFIGWGYWGFLGGYGRMVCIGWGFGFGCIWGWRCGGLNWIGFFWSIFFGEVVKYWFFILCIFGVFIGCVVGSIFFCVFGNLGFGLLFILWLFMDGFVIGFLMLGFIGICW